MSKLDVQIGITIEVNTTLLTQLTKSFLLLGLQRDQMESREKAFEERMETLYDNRRVPRAGKIFRR